MGVIRVLFLADTHLGFDLPFRPRIERRRRGPDFFANFERSLAPCFQGEVDCVVHGGDLLYRSRVPAPLVEMAFAPLRKVADQGVPVYVVPGNHERSRIPYRLLASHPEIHIFDEPKTFVCNVGGARLALAGFPYVRRDIREKFPLVVSRTGWQAVAAEVKILCIHHCVEGAKVGPSNYTFRYARDVIRAEHIPPGLDAVLSGHIHRFQVLTAGLRGKKINAPVFYPGSIERTSFAEREEKKGYLTFHFDPSAGEGERIRTWEFHELPARPMIQLVVNAERMDGNLLAATIKKIVKPLPKDSVLSLKINGITNPEGTAVLRAASLRSILPPTMNFNVKVSDF